MWATPGPREWSLTESSKAPGLSILPQQRADLPGPPAGSSLPTRSQPRAPSRTPTCRAVRQDGAAGSAAVCCDAAMNSDTLRFPCIPGTLPLLHRPVLVHSLGQRTSQAARGRPRPPVLIPGWTHLTEALMSPSDPLAPGLSSGVALR